MKLGVIKIGGVRKQNNYILYDNHAEIVIISPKYGEFRISIDLEDVDKCKGYYWHSRKWYNRRGNKFYFGARDDDKVILLHRFILDYDGKDVIDHISGDTTDNRKINLRVCTYTQNNMNATMFFKHNKSGHKGVCWYKTTGKWLASIRLDRKHIHIGYFDNLEDAVEARIKKEKEIFGEYSRREQESE